MPTEEIQGSIQDFELGVWSWGLSAKHEMQLSVERSPDTSGRLASFSSEGEEVGHHHKVGGGSIVAVGGPCFIVDTLTLDSQVAQLNKL